MKTVKNSYPILREAKVINTTDPEKLGRIQLKVYPELAEIEDAECPWAFPHTGGIHGKSFGVPLVDQLITCVVWNKYWCEISFLPFNITKPEEHIFDKWMKNQRSEVKDMKINPEEEHLVVDQYEDDFNVFHDTKESQHGILHPSGIYALVNKDGDIFINLVKKLIFHNEDNTVLTIVDSESGKVDLKVKGDIIVNTDGNAVVNAGGTIEIGSLKCTINNVLEVS